MEHCDVLVIGGGPGGSTASALLARAGWKVLQVEKAHHPRFHIGESLLPMNLPLFERLGVLDKVRALGVYKRGADFEADNPAGYLTYDFGRALGSSPPHAFQVWRADFDQMLFEHARDQGADTRDGVAVVAAEQSGSREWQVELDAGGKRSTIQARYLVDASGRDGFLAAKRKLRVRNAAHQSAAIFGHFRGAERRQGDDAGNISIYSFAHGWMWMIPLQGGMMSVGAVCRPSYLKQRRGDNRGFLEHTLALCPALAERMAGAELIDDKVHVTGNYSYDAKRMAGPGWIMVGDAFAFLDPVFSSGVYLAMTSAEQAVQVVDQSLRQPAREVALQRKLEQRMRRGMARFSYFIHRFNSPVMQGMFRSPRNTLRIEQGVISMLAGDLFDSRPVWWRLQVFKLIYGFTALRHYRMFRAEARQSRAEANTNFR